MNKGTFNHGDKRINIPFHKWVLGYLKHYKSAFTIGALIVVCFNPMLPYFSSILKEIPQIQVLYGTQALFIIVIAGIATFGPKPKIHQKYPRGIKAVMQFWKWWRYLWFAWALLYISLTFLYVVYSKDIKTEGDTLNDFTIATRFILHILNNIATIILIMFFHLLAEPTLSASPPEGDIYLDTEKSANSTSNKVIENNKFDDDEGIKNAKLMFWIILFISATMGEMALLWFCDPEIMSKKELIEIFGRFY